MSLPDGLSTGGAPPSGKFTHRQSFIMPFPALPTPHKRRSDNAVVTWVAGEAAYKWFSITGPAMRRYADAVHADLIVLEGYGAQPYLMANKFRVRQVFDEYGYEGVLYVDADILIKHDCLNFFELVPASDVAILDEGPHYDYWMLAHYRHEAAELLKSQGLDPGSSQIPTPKNAGFYLMRREHKDALTPFARPFPLCYRNGATVEQTWFCLMLQRYGVPLFPLACPRHHWLWYLDQSEQSTGQASVLHFCGLHDAGNRRYERLVANAAKFAVPSEGPRPAGSLCCDTVSAFDAQMLLDHPAPPGLSLRNNIVISSHQYGWAVALKALSVLSNPEGVLLDGFIENTFLWRLADNRKAAKIPYREPWVGFVHHPPGIPNWPSIARHKIQDLANVPEWSESLECCLGLFALTDYLAQWVRARWGVPCEVLRYPALRPDNVFSMANYDAHHPKIVTMVGFWLRRFTSFQMLNADGHRKIRPLLVEDPSSRGMDHVRAYEMEEAAARGATGRTSQAVEIVPRLSNTDYDDLLSKSVVFLDLIDASAVTVVTECLVRCTPLLVNPLPGVKEYLGDDYPCYFESLDEASEKLRDSCLVRAAHEHMICNPMRRRLEPQRFLDDFASTESYRRVLWRLSLA
jgi:hypothetical protein